MTTLDPPEAVEAAAVITREIREEVAVITVETATLEAVITVETIVIIPEDRDPIPREDPLAAVIRTPVGAIIPRSIPSLERETWRWRMVFITKTIREATNSIPYPKQRNCHPSSKKPMLNGINTICHPNTTDSENIHSLSPRYSLYSSSPSWGSQSIPMLLKII
jgi:hypothetical protein